MISYEKSWRQVEAGDTVWHAMAGRWVVAPGPWPSDAMASVALVDEHEAAAALRAAGFTWEVLQP